jgi:hypothetical protein
MDNIAKINAINVLLALAEKLLTEVAAAQGDEKMKQGLLQVAILRIYLDEVMDAKRSRK